MNRERDKIRMKYKYIYNTLILHVVGSHPCYEYSFYAVAGTQTKPIL